VTPVDYGARVVLRYRLSLADGTLVDASEEGDPLVLTVGDGTLEEGLEALLLGLGAGARATFHLAPGQAFGLPDPEAVHLLPRADFPEGMALEAGTVVAFTAPSGLEVAGTVLEAGEGGVRVDFSHPLAGRSLVFEVEVLEVHAKDRGSPGG
jgi:FKBP-type peptidyl-prolyl cis-trans isomerase SlpA